MSMMQNLRIPVGTYTGGSGGVFFFSFLLRALSDNVTLTFFLQTVHKHTNN